MTSPDPRLNAFRPDLADARLTGKVEAQRFVEGWPARVAAPVADLRAAPRADAGVDTQLLFGDDVTVFDEHGGWAWVQAAADGYVGYTRTAALGPPGQAATHVVAVPRSFVYPGPDLKRPAAMAHSMGARLRVEGEAETRGMRYALLPAGEAMAASHLRALGEHGSDYVAVAEQLVHAPYLWGGTSGFGLDCSGLVQLAMRMAGKAVLRDTDMQAASIGAPLQGGEQLRRGDLAFWQGHVAILTDPHTVIHANGATMTVALEPLESAVRRIEPLFGRPTCYRRP